MSRFTRHVRFAVSGARVGIKSSTATFLAAVLSIAVALTMSGVALLLQAEISKVKGYWYDKAQVSVYLCTADSADLNCTTGWDKAKIRAAIEDTGAAARIFFEDRDQAWGEFQSRFAGSEIIRSVPREAIPESYRIKLAPGADAARIVSALSVQPGVETVQDERKLLAGFFSVVSGVRIAALVFALLQGIGAGVLVANLVQTALGSRKDEIHIMGLVGARPRMIRAPFVAETALTCLVGGLLSTVLLTAGVGAMHTIAGFSTTATLSFVEVLRIAALQGVCALGVGWVITRVALRRPLRR